MTCRLLFRILEKKYKIQISTGVDYTLIAYLTGMNTKTKFWKSIILVAKATKISSLNCCYPEKMHWIFSFHLYTVYCRKIRYKFNITWRNHMLCLIYYKCAHACLCTRYKKEPFILSAKKKQLCVVRNWPSFKCQFVETTFW